MTSKGADLSDPNMGAATRPKAPAMPPVPTGFDPDLDHNLWQGKEEMNVDAGNETRGVPVKRSSLQAPPSPTRQKHEGRSQAVTLDDLRSLLGEQTKQIQESTQQDIQDLQTATFKELGNLKKEVRKHSDYIEQLREHQDRIEDRLQALEGKGWPSYPAASTTASDPGRPNLMIFSGWPQDTKKETVLNEFAACLPQLGLENAFEDYFCTGPRRGFLMAFIAQNPDETGTQLKRRMITLAQQVQKAGLHAPTMEPGKNLRATLGKSKEERMISNHAGKTKRLILTLAPNYKTSIETEYSAGSVWLNSRLVASATRQAPPGKHDKGKTPRSWIDLHHLASILNTPHADLQEQWTDLMSI